MIRKVAINGKQPQDRAISGGLQHQYGGQGLAFLYRHGHGHAETSSYGLCSISAAAWPISLKAASGVDACGPLSQQP